MYIQITTQCNMSCAHCSFSCEIGKPYQHMSWDIFCDALNWCEDYGSFAYIGGGEPTLHPEFWGMLQAAVRSAYGGFCEGVWLATNGKKTKDAIALAMLASSGELNEAYVDQLAEQAGLQYPNEDDFETPEDYNAAVDRYYEEKDRIIDQDPRTGGLPADAWEKFDCAVSRDAYHAPIDPAVYSAFSSRGLEIRDNTFDLVDVGAARKNQLGGKQHCACSDLMVQPDGTVKACGCPDSLVLGHISDQAELAPVVERYNNIKDDIGECGYFGVREEDQTKDVTEWKIRRDLIAYILYGRYAERFDPDYEDVDIREAA